MVTARGRSVGPGGGGARGFTYLWVLLAIAIIGVGLVAASEVWTTTARREKAEELEWIGGQFTQAIGSYYYASPGAAKAYPAALSDLVEDRRSVTVRRHLRSIYLNPYTGKADWELIRAGDGRIVGVRAAWTSNAAAVAKEFVYQPGSLAPAPR